MRAWTSICSALVAKDPADGAFAGTLHGDLVLSFTRTRPAGAVTVTGTVPRSPAGDTARDLRFQFTMKLEQLDPTDLVAPRFVR